MIHNIRAYSIYLYRYVLATKKAKRLTTLDIQCVHLFKSLHSYLANYLSRTVQCRNLNFNSELCT